MDLFDTPDGVLIRPVNAPLPRLDDRGLLVVKVGRPVTTGEVVAAITTDRERARG